MSGFKGENKGNYGGLKLTEQAMKILERIVDGLIRQVVSIDDSQFGFFPGRGTTDGFFVVQHLQAIYGLRDQQAIYGPLGSRESI